MPVILLFPPQFEPTQPYSSLPCLTAALRSAGIDTVQRDINLESFYYLLSQEFLLLCIGRLEDKIRYFETLTYLSLGDQECYATTVKALAIGEYVCTNVSDALESVRNYDSFRTFKKYSWAISIIKRALEIVSAAHYPSYFGLYETRIGTNPTSSDNGLESALDSQINPYVEWLESKIVPELVALSPDVVGISVTTIDQFVPALTLAQLFKKQAPDTFVVFGGAFITRTIHYLSNPKNFFSCVDGVIFGEGETALCELVDRLHRNEDLEGLKNLIVFRDGHLTQGSEYQETLEDLPLPDFDGLTLDQYLSPKLVLPYSTSRGCYYSKCTFCCHFYPVTKHREMSPDAVYKSLKQLCQKYGTQHFSFGDQAIRPLWLECFANNVCEGDIDIAWFTFVRFDDEFQRSRIETIASGGCKMLMFGLESANARVLDLMDKGIRLPIVDRILQDCTNIGIAIRLGMLVGFPGETKEESYATLNFLKNRLEILDQNCFAPPVSRYKLLRDTIVDCDPTRFGVTILAHPADEDLEREQHYVVKSGMTMEEAEHQYLSFVSFFINNFHAYKCIPDNKVHSFLYKCLANGNRLKPNSSVFLDEDNSCMDWIGKVRLLSTVVELDAAFDITRINDNTIWLDRESTFCRLREGKSLHKTRCKFIAQNKNKRTVNASPKTYLIDVVLQKAVEIPLPARWLARNLHKYSSWAALKEAFKKIHGWTPENEDIKNLLIQLNRTGMLTTFREQS